MKKTTLVVLCSLCVWMAGCGKDPGDRRAERPEDESQPAQSLNEEEVASPQIVEPVEVDAAKAPGIGAANSLPSALESPANVDLAPASPRIERPDESRATETAPTPAVRPSPAPGSAAFAPPRVNTPPRSVPLSPTMSNPLRQPKSLPIAPAPRIDSPPPTAMRMTAEPEEAVGAEGPSDEAPPEVAAPRVAAMEMSEEPAPHSSIDERAAEPPAPTDDKPAVEESDDYTVVKVFYGTDRRALGAAAVQGIDLLHYLPPVLAGIVSLLAVVGLVYSSRKRLLAAVAVVGVISAGGLGFHAYSTHPQASSASLRVYGNERGRLEMGICEVTIPKSHQEGQVERPSILRLEVREDARKHIVLRSVVAREQAAFFAELREVVAASPRKEALIFIHGYNVAFESAAQRTAQMAHDLKFQGAPVFYSWPSQGGLLQYTVDETNVVWTVPHLKQFLLEVATQSGAKSINLVAHSMGNRALTSALRELTYELESEPLLFNQIVLAAPDIDAEIFRRDIAPAVAKTARQVTLYASSDDRALLASKKIHGYPRAGDSRPALVVVPEIETIDVSGIDTSLLGHSYYGSSQAILVDIAEIIRSGLPAADRRHLRPYRRQGLTYWAFDGDLSTLPKLDDVLR